MQVSDVAKQAGVPAHVVRYYTKLELLSPTRNPVNQYRDYDVTEVHRVKFIRRAKYLGFTLADVRAILCDADKGESACSKARVLIKQRLAEHAEHIKALQALQQRMSDAISVWDTMPDNTPTGHSLCHLIETVTSTDDEENSSSEDLEKRLAKGHPKWDG